MHFHVEPLSAGTYTNKVLKTTNVTVRFIY